MTLPNLIYTGINRTISGPTIFAYCPTIEYVGETFGRVDNPNPSRMEESLSNRVFNPFMNYSHPTTVTFCYG